VDANRQGLGRGHLDLPGCLTALDRIGYTGPLVLEVMAPGPDPFRAVKDERSPRLVDEFRRESLARLRTLGVAR
jgi:sugar phosphate isomerase/epimerase